jgi:nucleoside-diphosphate-sugar epimerase
VVDEDTVPEPDGFRGEILLEAEQAARDWDGPVSVLRASGIYGPGRDRLIRLAAEGAPLAPGDRWTNRIHRDDLAAAIRHGLLHPSPSPLYLASDLEPALLSDVLAWISTGLGRDAPARPGSGTGSAERSSAAVGGRRCIGRRLTEEGFSFRYPSWREGYLQLMRSAAHP